MTPGIETMTPDQKADSHTQLVARLNAELRGRDPNEIWRRRVRNATLDELEERAKAGLNGLGEAPAARRMLRIVADMRAGK
jgi:hypothetical protein